MVNNGFLCCSLQSIPSLYIVEGVAAQSSSSKLMIANLIGDFQPKSSCEFLVFTVKPLRIMFDFSRSECA